MSRSPKKSKVAPAITKKILIVLYGAVIFWFSLQLTWLNQLFFIAFSALAGYLFFGLWHEKGLTQESSDQSGWSGWWAILPMIILLFTRTIIYIHYSDFPQLGYDMGIYKYEFEHANTLQAALKTTFYPGLIVLTALLQKIGFSIDFLMREFYIFLQLLIGLMVYLTGREFFGKRAGLLALILYVSSLTHFTAYYFFLYKNTLALSLLLGTFILLNRRSYFAILPGLYLGIVQPPDFMILAISMLAMFVYRFRQPKERNYLLITGSVIAGLFLLAFLSRFDQIREGINLILRHKEHWDPSISGGGSFISFAGYIERAIYYLPMLFLGIIASLWSDKKKPVTYLHFAFLVVAIIVCFKLIFYRRYLIELDLIAVIFAGLGFSYLLGFFKQKLWQKIAWSALCLALMVNIVLESWYATPLIPSLEAARIGTLCKLPKNALVMATDNFYSPWLRGYSCHEVIAPGLFQLDQWDQEEWKEFWTGEQEKVERKMSELTYHHRPIYLFIGDLQPNLDFTGFTGFSKIRSYLWRWDYPR